ncbi:hypothetical protein ACJX0J_036627, partial [Zea mays]
FFQLIQEMRTMFLIKKGYMAVTGHFIDDTVGILIAGIAIPYKKAMIAKYDKYWTDVQGLMAIAMTMLHACYIALLGEEEAEIYVSKSYEYLLQSDQDATAVFKNELDRYLEEETLPHDENELIAHDLLNHLLAL